MDFEAVPAGTLPAAALVLRGPDPNLSVPAGNSLDTCVGASLHAVNAAGGLRHFKYSGIGGLLAGAFFTRDPAVLQALLHGSVIAPAKLWALWLYFTANGINAATASTPSYILTAIEAIVATWAAPGAVPAAATLTAADLFTTEAPTGALGGNLALVRVSRIFIRNKGGRAKRAFQKAPRKYRGLGGSVRGSKRHE